MTGAELISKERARQLEGWSNDHDGQHSSGELALAAVAYATPVKLYTASGSAFVDPWPWNDVYDRRWRYGENKVNRATVLPDPSSYTAEERLDLLIKAGALIAAEIDRMQRLIPLIEK